MSRFVIIVGLVAVLMASRAEAQLSCGGPCATLPEQIIQQGELVLQYGKETITAAQEVLNTLGLGSTVFADLSADINTLSGLVNTANMLIGNTGQIITNLTGGGHGYPLGSIANWHQQYSNETAAVGLALKVCGQVTNTLQSISNDAVLFASFVNQVQGIVGRLQGLQNAAGSISQLGQMSQKIAMGGLACRQGAATYYAAQQDHLAVAQAVNDQDLETSFWAECANLAALGGSLPGCGGSATPPAGVASQDFSATTSAGG